ncbi:hypothetical protein LVD15_00595 [Fulvivirga maritima]|uniref:hypothetical protein n=1 Tax=Fulvivirga maritima TaxID=2904247 RepID=UPI001F471BE7|nr:hypothetical protein [Fulvivirga maritima]UII26968.1 hypothetical protein LVD15_00595 [Fulvivirga maritima]
MSEVEKIDAYFGNEMTEAEKMDFENSVQNDPSLKKEFEFQNDIVNALRENRKAELKAMLNKVPVSGSMSAGSSFSVGKIASLIVGAAIMGISVYFLTNSDAAESTATISTTENQPVKPETLLEPAISNEKSNSDEELISIESEQASSSESNEANVQNFSDEQSSPEKSEDNMTSVSSTTNNTEATQNVVVSKPEINKPVLSNFNDAQNNADSLEAPGGSLVNKTYKEQKSIEVEIEEGSKRHNFHYHFVDGKLFLLGDFDKNLYEILEINTDSDKAIFLYYKDQYYSLDKQQEKIEALTPIKDNSLVAKLERIRSEE